MSDNQPRIDRRPYRNRPRNRISRPKNLYHSAIHVHVAQKIRRTRRALGLTQEETATALGMYRQNYQVLETGQRRLQLEMIMTLASYFRVPYLYLLEGYVPPKARRIERGVRLDVTDPVAMGADPMAPQAPDTTPIDTRPSYLVVE
jgi:transcriptional regulator with XRE-family HTH domain